MMFLTKLMLLAASETDADLSTVLEETKAVAEEVHEDLQNLKPNVILETLKSWLPGLMSFGYRLVIAILILVIGNRIVHAVRKFLHKTFTHMNMDPSISRFLISVADACWVLPAWPSACLCRAAWRMWRAAFYLCCCVRSVFMIIS